jgi:cytochrome b
METKNPRKTSNNVQSTKILVWDLPTRLFHWLLFLGVVVSFVTGNIGGNSMEKHMLSGYAILALLLFRLAWGFVGSPSSRFSSFIKGPTTVGVYAANLFKKDEKPFLGHNPLGGWSILSMLLFLFVQVGSGLFASDDVLTQGPLYAGVSQETSRLLTGIHLINRYALVAIIAVHIFAILFHYFYKGENLLRSMITGMKMGQGTAEIHPGRNLTAAAIFALALILVYLLVR